MPKTCTSCGIVWTSDVCPECAESPGAEPRDVVHARPVAVPLRAAIAGLLLNGLVWPGLGSLLVGRQSGWVQGSLALVAVVFLIADEWIVAGVLAGSAWLWGVATAVATLNLARSPARAALVAPEADIGIAARHRRRRPSAQRDE